MDLLTGHAMPDRYDNLLDLDSTISIKVSASTLNTLWSSQGSSLAGLSRSETPNTIYSQPSFTSTRTRPTLISRHYQKPLPQVPLSNFAACEGPAGACSNLEHDKPPLYPLGPPSHVADFRPNLSRNNTGNTSHVKSTKESKTAEKKANNPFACPYCPETFSKSSDRKKHFNNRCKSLGDGSPAWECFQCHHLARSESQIKDHQRKAGHPKSSCGPTYLPTKPRFTCSDDGIIYTDAEDFLEHFAHGSPCRLNDFNTHGDHFHRARLRTLLQEGRDDENAHSYIYAELRAYCAARTWPAARWKEVILSLPEEVAEFFAAKLEWGLVPNDGTALSRLGFFDLPQIVTEILSSGLSYYVRPRTARSLIQGLTDTEQQYASPVGEPIPNEDPYLPFAVPTISHVADSYEDTRPMYHEGHFQETWVQSPVGRGSAEYITTASLNTNVLPDQDDSLPWDLTNYDGSERIVPDMKQNEQCSQSPILDSLMGGFRSSPHVPDDEFIAHADSVETNDVCHHEQYDAQLLQPEPTKRKAKRPISEGSRVLPEEVARAVNPPTIRPKEYPKKSSSQRSSNGSTGGIFDFQKYYDDDATASNIEVASFTPLEPVYLRQGAPTPAPSTYYIPAPAPPSSTFQSPSTSLTSKAKAYIQSLPSASLRNGVREIDDVPEQDAFGQPAAFSWPGTSTGSVSQLRCLHCRRDNCYLGIACPATRKGRRSGGVYGRQDGEWRVQS